MSIKLRGKILLLPLVLFVLALAVSGWYAYSVARTELTSSVMETLDAHSDALALSLDAAADAIAQDVASLSHIPAVQMIIRMPGDLVSARYIDLQRDIFSAFSIRTRNELYKRLDVIDAEGTIIASSDHAFTGSSIRADKNYRSACDITEVVFGQAYTEERNKTLVPVFAPIFQNNVQVGCVRAVIDFAVLAERYVEHIRLGDGGHAFVAAPGGFIMTHPVREFIMEPIVPTDRTPHMAAQREGSLQYQWNGSTWLALFHTGRETGWTSIVKVNLDEMFSPIKDVQEKILFMNGLWIVGFCLLMIVISGRISAALLKTIEYARQVANGSLNEELTLHSKDEVGTLADSLRAMVRSLRAMLVQSAEQQRELERVSQHKSDFLANMSHEIRTPMNAITGFTSLFRRDNLDARQLGYLDKITVASKAMLQIINDVLDLSKIERGKLQVESIPFSLRDSITSASGVVEFSAQAKGLDYSVDIDPAIPAMVTGDPTRVQQVLFNLLGNAVKFTSSGGVSLRVRLAAEAAPALSSDQASGDALGQTLGQTLGESLGEVERERLCLLFEIADTGIGITPEQLEHLFNPFSQADASITRKFGGTGLGLAISKKLVELMGGTIGATSTPGEGTTFSFTIVVDVPQEQEFAARNVTDWRTDKLEGYRILVVEDNEINQEIICSMLETFGLTDVAVANNGREALDLVARQSFDLILMDMQMPVMDGVSATLKLREMGRTDGPAYLHEVPIVALTANALSTDVERCTAAGMNGHLSKPVMPELLHAMLDNMLRG